MLQRLALSVAGTLVTSQIAVASPMIMDRLLPKGAAAAASQCANFDGLWAGQCTVTVNDQVQHLADVRVVHQYGCNLLADGSSLIAVGGLKDESLAFQFGEPAANIALGISQAADWNATKTALNLHTVTRTRAMGEGTPISLNIDSTMSVDGDKLYEQGSTKPAAGGVAVKVSCDYDRE